MQAPKVVNNAVIALWASIAVSALGSLLALKAKQITSGDFAFSIFFYGFMCILPYKISNRSNAARYVLLILFCMSLLISISGIIKLSRIEYIFSFIETILTAYVLFNLFQQQSNSWFSKRNPPSPLR